MKMSRDIEQEKFLLGTTDDIAEKLSNKDTYNQALDLIEMNTKESKEHVMMLSQNNYLTLPTVHKHKKKVVWRKGKRRLI